MTELEKLEKRIKSKFGSKSSFYRCTGLEERDMQIFFTCERRSPNSNDERDITMAKLSNIVKETSPSSDPKKLSPEIRAKITKEIDSRGGVYKFNKDNPEFKRATVYQAIQGRRVKMNGKTSELIRFLGIT